MTTNGCVDSHTASADSTVWRPRFSIEKLSDVLTTVSFVNSALPLITAHGTDAARPWCGSSTTGIENSGTSICKHFEYTPIQHFVES